MSKCPKRVHGPLHPRFSMERKKETYQETWVALADIRAYTFASARTGMQVITVKLGTVLSCPPTVTETDSPNTVTIVKTRVWTVDD